MAGKRSVRLVYKPTIGYTVIGVVNTTELVPGQGVSKAEIDQLIHRNFEVRIVG